MVQVIMYIKEDCLLCDEAYTLLELLQLQYEFTVELRDIYTCDAWLMEYQLMIPVIMIHDELFYGEHLHYEAIEKCLNKYL